MKLTVKIDAEDAGQILANAAVVKFDLQNRLSNADVNIFYARDEAQRLIEVQVTFEVQDNEI